MGLALVCCASVAILYPVVAVPAFYDRAYLLIAVVPLVVPALGVQAFTCPHRDLEAGLPGATLRRLRLEWYLVASCVGVTALVLVNLAWQTGMAETLYDLRQLAWGMAMAVTSAVITPARISWMPPLVAGMGLWIFGTDPDSGAGYAWALPLASWESWPAAATALAAWAGAGFLYLIRDGAERN
ncbi:hypothetical protein H8R18_06245 [Nanchangia anserum]|uniref:Uncharacterized protein n=1 Tax=Nanchangia anserum TaxID=2692125 RepID=A0A8I0GFL2_9ACTO|nr:hypothetical protein [Nanchangia anserum]MBD3689134.1 hypothetical protein [Nanchangia anserum]QOX81368.1 hypothetical protein H8R18_06245 [Nanchangia anserum]